MLIKLILCAVIVGATFMSDASAPTPSAASVTPGGPPLAQANGAQEQVIQMGQPCDLDFAQLDAQFEEAHRNAGGKSRVVFDYFSKMYLKELSDLYNDGSRLKAANPEGTLPRLKLSRFVYNWHMPSAKAGVTTAENMQDIVKLHVPMLIPPIVSDTICAHNQPSESLLRQVFLPHMGNVLSSEGKLPLVELTRVDSLDRAHTIAHHLPKGLSLTKTDIDNNTVMHAAMRSPSHILPVVLDLIKARPDGERRNILNWRDKYGQTPILILLKKDDGTINKDSDTITQCIDMGADPTIADNYGISLATLAQGRPSSTLVWLQSFAAAKKQEQEAAKGNKRARSKTPEAQEKK